MTAPSTAAQPRIGSLPDSALPAFLDERKALACIHCGLCLSSCPTYLETGNENDSPRGRIYLMKALQSGRLSLSDETVGHIDLCLGCRACEAACPSGVQYGTLLEGTREYIEARYKRSFWQTFLRRVAIEKVFPFRWRFKAALLPLKLIRFLKIEHWLPHFAREAAALIPAHSVEAVIPEFVPASKSPSLGKIGFVRGCVMNVLFGDTNLASIRLLTAAGYDVVTPRDQQCCGALYAHGGNLVKARESARQNIAAFEKHGCTAIIINAAGCGSTLKEYGHLLAGDPAWAERGERFSSQVKDLTEWLVNLPPGSSQQDGLHQDKSEAVTFHDACHLVHAQRIAEAPRALIRAVAGDSFVELPESDVCCGSAGSYNLTEPEMAERLQKRKIENILRTGARVVSVCSIRLAG